MAPKSLKGCQRTSFKLIVALDVVLGRRVGHVGQPGHARVAELLLPVAPDVLEEGDDAGDDEAADENDEDAADVGQAERGGRAVNRDLTLASALLLLPPLLFQHVQLAA